MRRLIVTEFITLDGRFETPEKWSFPHQNDETAKVKWDELVACDALLLGAATYKIFASSWPTRSGEFADQMNGIAKYVVTSKIKRLTWNNSRRIEGNIAKAVAELKSQPGKDIGVAGSAKLADLLLKAKLVDVLRLMVHPIVLGEGRRLFRDGTPANLRLANIEKYSTGMILLEYLPENK